MPASRLKLTEQSPPPSELPETISLLTQRYLPTPPVPRLASEPLDGLISTILSQQNTAAITRRQFEALQAAYPTWGAALADGPDGIAPVLKAAGGGLSRIKADYIWNVLNQLAEQRGQLSLRDLRQMSDAEVRSLLEGFWGVGMKTASCVMLFDLGRAAMPVDTHIQRLARRLDWVPSNWNAVKIEMWFDEVLPRTWQQRYTFHVAFGTDAKPARPSALCAANVCLGRCVHQQESFCRALLNDSPHRFQHRPKTN